jgi:hypothetical protein
MFNQVNAKKAEAFAYWSVPYEGLFSEDRAVVDIPGR